MLMDLADRHAGNRIVSVLEGGYDLQALTELGRGACQSADDGIRKRVGMPEATSVAVGELSFEKALEELEKIVARLERGEVPLAESITIYERGEELKKHCERLLGEAEARVEKIRVGGDGKPRGIEPLDEDVPF